MIFLTSALCLSLAPARNSNIDCFVQLRVEMFVTHHSRTVSSVAPSAWTERLIEQHVGRREHQWEYDTLGFIRMANALTLLLDV